MTKIIGHRGARGLALENSIEAIKAGAKAGADGLEFDIRLSSDDTFFLCHDPNTGRTAQENMWVTRNDSIKLRNITLKNGEKLPTLPAAIQAAGTVPLFIEAKGSDWADQLAHYLKASNLDLSRTSVISDNHLELEKFHQHMPTVRIFILVRLMMLERIFTLCQFAKKHGFTGIDINYCLLNPLTYWYARRLKLQVIVYTVDFTFMARCLAFIYRDISITTNRPDKMRALQDDIV